MAQAAHQYRATGQARLAAQVSPEYKRAPAELKLVKGGRLRSASKAQQAPSASMNLVLIAAVVFAIIISICGIRVTFSALTVSTMMQNNKLQTQINEARAKADDLQVQRSVFANPSRIERIAVDSLGMVPVTQVTELALDSK